MIALLLILCTHNGAETLRAPVPSDAVLWTAAQSPGVAVASFWKLGTPVFPLPDPSVPTVMLVPTVRNGVESALMIVDPRDCVVGP